MVDSTRRKLLRMTAYVPPAILGTMTSTTAFAEEQIIVSAHGNACLPCSNQLDQKTHKKLNKKTAVKQCDEYRKKEAEHGSKTTLDNTKAHRGY